MIKKTLAAVALGLTLTASWAQEINFGFISTESSANIKSDWQPLLDDMAKQTGLKIKAFFASDYAGIIEGMRFNKVQVAWLGNKSAMEAVDRANGEIFAQMVNADGTQGYYVFSKNKIDPKSFFKVVRNANHETNALAVANKQVDVATNNSENLDKIKERQPEKFKDIRVIWTSPLIPLDPLVLSKELPPATKEKIKTFFYNYAKTDAREKEIVFKISKLSGFKPSTNAQLTPIRELDLFSKRNKIDADTTLAAADKAAKLAEIDKLLAALQ